LCHIFSEDRTTVLHGLFVVTGSSFTFLFLLVISFLLLSPFFSFINFFGPIFIFCLNDRNIVRTICFQIWRIPRTA